LHARLSEAIAQAGCKWLVSVDEVVPVWSGASKATFTELAHQVGYPLSIGVSSTAPDRIDLGLETGTATFETNPATGIYSFSYETTLPHLIVNEYCNANTFINPQTQRPYFHLLHPGPYHFQEKGQKAFRDYVAHDFECLPDWRQCITVQQISVG
jgi:hypothetical protein